jgi:hypothetical protein
MTTAISDQVAVDALISDLLGQIDQFRARGVKGNDGRPYTAPVYKRGLQKAIAGGGQDVVDFVRGYLYKAPSDGYKKLERAAALDLCCEALVQDDSASYAHLFSDEDRAAACERLAPHIAAIEARRAERRARIDAARARLRAKGMPSRLDLDGAIRSRRPSR